MKKVFLTLTLVASLCITSCNKDDDSQDKIIGTWTLVSDYSIVNGQTTNDTLTDCQKTSFVAFSADGAFNTKSYYLDSDNMCFLDYESTGTWKNLGDSIYETMYDGDTFKGEISFSGNTFSTSTIEGDITYVSVYQKQ